MNIKVPIWLRRSAVGRIIFKRNSKKKLAKKANKVNIPSNNFLKDPFQRTFNFFKDKQAFFFFALLFFLLILGVAHLIQLYSLSTKAYFPETSSEELNVVGEGKTTLFLGIDEEDGYNYIYYVNVIIDNGSEFDFLLINPLFSIRNIQTNESSTIKSFLNTTNPETAMVDLKLALSNLLGIRIDRYIAFEKDELLALQANLASPIKFEIDSIDTIFNTQSLVNDNSLQVQEDFTTSFFRGSFTRLKRYYFFWNGHKLLEVFKTNHTSFDLIDIINRIRREGNFNSITSISKREGIITENFETEQIIRPDFILIDEKIKENYINVSILAEQAEIEIYNASEIRGLASRKQREFENIGGNVVKYGNYFEQLEENTLFLEDESYLDIYPNTINMIRNSLRGDLKFVFGEYEYNKTGDIILVLAKE